MTQVARRGVTLVELLVVLGILAVVLALLLPAIQRVRAAADVVVCASNLYQLALAAHHFQADHNRLPPGYLGPSLANQEDFPAHLQNGQWLGQLYLLLPYLEQSATQVDSLDTSPAIVAPYPWFWASAAQNIDLAHYALARRRVKLLLCPAASPYEPEVGNPAPGGGGTILGLHVFNSPTHGVRTVGWRDDYVKSAAFVSLGRTHYVGVAGCGAGSHPLYSVFEGLYSNRSRNDLAQTTARDGTSHTLLYGEACGTFWNGSPPDSMDISWMGGGALGTYGGLHRAGQAELIHFSSYHAHGVQFAFADGSVRCLRRGTTAVEGSAHWAILQELAGWHDAGRSDLSGLLD